VCWTTLFSYVHTFVHTFVHTVHTLAAAAAELPVHQSLSQLTNIHSFFPTQHGSKS
jgi:hypothetical protein